MNPDKVRRLGWVLAIIGSLLAVAMALAFYTLAPSFLNPGELIDDSKFTGTLKQGQMALTLFGVVMAFGVLSTILGVFQIKTGRQNSPLRYAVFGLFGLIWVMVFQLNSALGG